MKNVIEAFDLTKSYGDEVKVQALCGVSLRVEEASFVAIMGPSGSGKSTLLHILGALEPPDSGRLLLEGSEIERLSDKERTELRRRRIGFVFQQFNLLPIFTTLENVALPLRLEGIRSSEAERRSLEMLSLVGLDDRQDRLPSQLSGGEQQRVAIARALVTRPAIILADEPTGNLDSKNSSRLIGLFRTLVNEHGQTVVMVTHDPSVASRADRTIFVRDGQISEEHDPQKAVSQVAVAEGAGE